MLEKRFIKNTELLAKLAKVQDNLNTISMAADLKKKFIAKKAGSQAILDQFGNPVLVDSDALEGNSGDRSSRGRNRREEDLPTWSPSPTSSAAPEEKSKETGSDKSPRNDGKSIGEHVSDMFHPTDGAVGKGYTGGKKIVEDRVTPGGEAGYNKDQEFMDYGEREQRREAMLMDLIITDPILSEEDPDEVINIYNTIKEMSPRLAEDKNVMRVALRSAIQHEGIAPQDIKQFLEVEHDMQKLRNNIDAENKREYVLGSSEKALKQKPQPRIV